MVEPVSEWKICLSPQIYITHNQLLLKEPSKVRLKIHWVQMYWYQYLAEKSLLLGTLFHDKVSSCIGEDMYEISGVAEVCGALSEVGGLGPLAPMSSQVIFWLGAPSGPLMSGGP